MLWSLSNVIFPLLSYPIVTKALGASSLGLVASTDSIGQFLVVLTSVGIPLYGARGIARLYNDGKRRQTLFWELFNQQFKLGIVAAVLMGGVGLLILGPSLLTLLAVISVIAASISCEWYFQGTEQFVFIAVRSFFLKGLTVVAIYLWVRAPSDIYIYYCALVAAVFVTSALNVALIIRTEGFEFRLFKNETRFSYLTWIYACTVLISVYTLLDTMVVKLLAGDQAAGYYNFAYRLVRMASMFIIALGSTFIPQLSFQFGQEDMQAFRKQSAISLRIIVFFSIPLSLCFLILAPEIVLALAGKGFEASIQVIRILSFTPLIISLSHFSGFQVMISSNQEKVFSLFLLIGAVASLCLNYFLVPKFSEAGAAWTNLSVELFITIGTMAFLKIRKVVSIESYYVIRIAAASVLIWPIALLFRVYNFSHLEILVYSLLLFAVLYLTINLLLNDPVLSIFYKIKK